MTYTPTATLWGLDSFTYGITGNTGAATTPVTVLVGPPASTLTTTYATAATVAVPGGGSCGGCSFSVGAAPAHGSVTVSPSTGASTYLPGAGYAGTDSFTYQVKDPVSALSMPGTVTVTVGPDAVDDTASTLIGNPVSGDVSTNDSCPATCTRTLLTQTASGSVAFRADGTWTYTPSTRIGPTSFTYRVASSVSGSASDDATVRIDVRGAVDDTATTAIGTPVTINVVANDSCPGCTLSSVTAPTSGSAVLSAGAVRYTPPAGFSGKATFSYTLSQGGASTSATVTVSVLPQAVDDAATTFVGTDVQILPLDNDLCANCALTSLGTPTAGTASRAGDIVTY